MHQIFLRTLPSELGNGESQNIIRFFEHPCGLGIVARQRSTHSDVLGALSWEEKRKGHHQKALEGVQWAALRSL